jgi:O-acetyl-ADP-ribose deacetylase (regulator of RNase III)
VYGYPPEQAAPIALAEARDALARYHRLELVRFVLFSDELYRTFDRASTSR